MKIVVTADIHIHPYRQCSRDGGHDRMLDGLSCLRQSLDLAREQGAAWVFAGDFKMPKTFWPQQALTGAHAVLREYGDVPKLMIAGNHDARGVGGSGLAPFQDCATIVDEPSVVVVGDTIFACAPWDADRAHVVKLLKDARDVGEKMPLIAHAFLAGCALGPEDVRLGKGVPVEEYGDFPVAFFGDVHKGQWRRPGNPVAVRYGGGPPVWTAYGDDLEALSDDMSIRALAPWRGEVFYPGSPYQQNWGERNDGQKGALLADLATGEVRLHAFDAPKFRHVELVEEQLGEFIDQQEEGEYERDFLRVVYTGSACPALDHLREIKCRSFQLVLRRAQATEKRAEIHAGMGSRELIDRYVAARPVSDVDRERVIEAGLRLMG